MFYAFLLFIVSIFIFIINVLINLISYHLSQISKIFFLFFEFKILIYILLNYGCLISILSKVFINPLKKYLD